VPGLSHGRVLQQGVPAGALWPQHKQGCRRFSKKLGGKGVPASDRTWWCRRRRASRSENRRWPPRWGGSNVTEAGEPTRRRPLLRAHGRRAVARVPSVWAPVRCVAQGARAGSWRGRGASECPLCPYAQPVGGGHQDLRRCRGGSSGTGALCPRSDHRTGASIRPAWWQGRGGLLAPALRAGRAFEGTRHSGCW
jgi:hypothetical protein